MTSEQNGAGAPVQQQPRHARTGADEALEWLHGRAGDASSEGDSLIRPYVRTGGRTKPVHDLALESLILTSEEGRVSTTVGRTEYQSICKLCRATRSVAEVAAHLRLPLGVTKVLIEDLAGLGMVRVYRNVNLDDRPSTEIMERVLSGLRRL